MCHRCSVLESMCRLRVALRHDAPREMLQRTTVLTRRKMEMIVPSITAVWTTVLDMPIQETVVPDRPIRGTTVPSRQKDMLSELTCPMRTGYGMSSLNNYGLATDRELLGSDHVL